jgi:hypothetical protein
VADVQLSIVVRARDLATKTIANIGPTAQRAGALARRAFDSMSGGIKAVGAGIAKMLTPGFGKLIALFAGFQVIRSMVRHAHDFRIAMAEVSTIVDTSAVSMEVLTRGVRELAKAHGAHEQVVAKGLYQAISAGVEAGAKSLIFLERASELAIAGVADTEQAVDVLTTVLNAYGLQVEQATRVSDVLFKTVELGKTTIPELAQNLGQAIPFAATLGTTLEEVAAIMATVTKGGINTAEAATGIKSVMAALINPVQDAADALRGARRDHREDARQRRGDHADLSEHPRPRPDLRHHGQAGRRVPQDPGAAQERRGRDEARVREADGGARETPGRHSEQLEDSVQRDRAHDHHGGRARRRLDGRGRRAFGEEPGDRRRRRRRARGRGRARDRQAPRGLRWIHREGGWR